jgi:hypothetical protein
LLAIRHAGIAVALAALAPLISSNLTSTIDTAREQGTAAVLDARLAPEKKIEIAPELFGSLNTDDPRGDLKRSIAQARAGLDPDEASELDRLGGLILVWAALGAAVILRPAVATAAVAGVIAAGGYGIAYASSSRETVKIGDPCQDRELPGVGGIGGALQDLSLEALDRAACNIGSSREQLLLALVDDRLREKFEQKYGVDPRSPLGLGGALLGL